MGIEIDIGKRIKSYREAAGLHQEDLARMCYVSRQTVSNWERNKTLPDIGSLKVIADAFGTTVDALIGDGEPQIARRVFDEARRVASLFFANHGMMLLFYASQVIVNANDTFATFLLRQLIPVFAGAWIVISLLYVRAVKTNKLDSMDDILRFAEPGLRTSTSSAAAIGLFLIRHRTASCRVYCMVLLVCLFQAQGLLSPLTALIIVAFSAALPLISMRLNKTS